MEKSETIGTLINKVAGKLDERGKQVEPKTKEISMRNGNGSLLNHNTTMSLGLAIALGAMFIIGERRLTSLERIMDNHTTQTGIHHYMRSYLEDNYIHKNTYHPFQRSVEDKLDEIRKDIRLLLFNIQHDGSPLQSTTPAKKKDATLTNPH